MKTETWKTKAVLCLAACTALATTQLARADYPSAVLSQNPVGYYRLNETLQPAAGSGTAANAGTMGASAAGTYNNYPTRGLTGPFAGSTAVGLDGASQSVTTPWVSGLNGNSFSVELWVNPDQVPYPGNVAYVATSVHIGSAAPGRSGWYLAQDNGATFVAGNAFVVRMFNQNGAVQTVQLAAPLTGPAGTWYHLVLTYDGTTAALYMNGALATNAPAAYVANADSQFSVGTRSDNNFYWPGKAAEVAMYTTALTAGQVAAHYSTATTTPANYATTVLADSPVLYHRYKEAIDPPAANLGTLGSGASGLYIYDAKAGAAGPRTPTYPGFEAGNNAAAFDAGGGVVRIPRLDLNTNTVTISCWVNATNLQSLGAGIVVHGSGANACGLTIDQVYGGLGLGYVWNGNNYGISPNLDLGLPALPDSQWAFAALVIQPAEADLYICDGTNFGNWMGVTNNFNVNHLAQSFASATLVGSASGYTNRHFNGAVDEVSIFNRALAAGELYTQYATAVGGVPPRFFVDLQGPTDSVAVGDPIVLWVDAGGTAPLTFHWRTNGVTAAVTTTNVFVIASASLGDAANYDVIVSNSVDTATSQQLAVNVVNPTTPTIVGLQGYLSRTLYPTGTLSMAVSATGGGLKYQWYKNAAPIASATASAYKLSRVTTNDAGAYSVSVTNSMGAATSGAPAMIVIPAPATGSYEATVVAAGPEAWWRLDETPGSTNMFDSMGRHDGIYTNAAGGSTLPALGVTGALLNNPNKAASFSSAGQGVGLAPYAASLNPAQFTVEAWVKTSVTDNQAPVSSTDGAGGWWWQTRSGQWAPYNPGGYAPISDYNPQSPVVADRWTQLVITYDATRMISGTAYPYQYYVNGQGDGYVWTGDDANSAGPFVIGGRGQFTGGVSVDLLFDGAVDEVAVYPRLLSLTEITNHYVARGIETYPPSFNGQPLSQTVVEGKTINFATTVLGSAPIALQWYKGVSPITDATNASYTIGSVSVADTGTYTLWATNSAGTNSISASLTVIPATGYANVTNELVLHLKFENDTTDSSGRGNNATPVGSPTFVAGKVGSQAFHFNTDTAGSVYNYATLGATIPNDLLFSSNVNFSVAYWVRLPAGATPGDLPILCSAVNSWGDDGLTIAPSYQRGGWSFALNSTGVYGPDNSINNGNWHNVIHTFDRSGNALTYLDGVLVNSYAIAAAGDIDRSGAMNIGQGATGTYGESGAIDIDDLGVWRRLLTPLEAAQIASAGSAGRSFDTVAPPSPNLTISYSGGNIVINYAFGTLVESTDPTLTKDAWTPVAGANPPSHTVAPGGVKKFYAVRQ